jgi:cyclophilin family peptidyl-prolyl cis-trans isomerase
MNRERSSTIDLSGLEETFEWFKARRNLFIGLAMAIFLVWSTIAFVNKQVEASRVRPWKIVFGSSALPWDADAEDLAAARVDPDVNSTSAEEYLAYWQALRRADGGDALKALDDFKDFASAFASSAFGRTEPITGRFSRALIPPANRVPAGLLTYGDWREAISTRGSSFPHTETHHITLVTDRGEFSLRLFGDRAPRSVELFLGVVDRFRGAYIARTLAGAWIDFGHDNSGVALKLPEGEADGFPPFESTRLSHLAGAVGFRQAPFSTGEKGLDVRVFLSSDPAVDERSTVFGAVDQGLDLLRSFSADAVSDEDRERFLEPILISQVRLEGPRQPAGNESER